MGILISSLHKGSLSRRRKFPLDLPNELWLEIFQMLDDPMLVTVSQVNHAFNALALPVYLSHHEMPLSLLSAGTLIIPSNRPHTFAVLQTAVFLPPVRHLRCSDYGNDGFRNIRYLTRLISRQAALERVNLTFYGEILTAGYRAKPKHVPGRIMQREVMKLLNCMMPTGKTLILSGNRTLIISGAARKDMWRVVRRVIPIRGFRAKLRGAAVALKMHRPTEVVLRTVCELDGVVYRDWHTLDTFQSVDVNYSDSPAEWAVLVLSAGIISRFNISPTLTASDWAGVLPKISLPNLQELGMGPATVFDLCDVNKADVDAFLIRHPHLLQLRYTPQLPDSNHLVPPSSLLQSLLHLTHLTTTPAHFIHLHHSSLSLTELTLFEPASTPGSADKDFPSVLRLLARNTQPKGLRLCIPGAWITVPPALLSIRCVAILLLVGDFTLEVSALVAFLALFRDSGSGASDDSDAPEGLKKVELHPTNGRFFDRLRVVDALRRQLPWLAEVSCGRKQPKAGSPVQIVDPSKRVLSNVVYEDV
ncbi:hypothetical protein C8R43DRAFT_1001633 [Mycena crocata]|nr:hypothetical protein C8R43DRAFT_1001633 [Mycena crocata]